MNVEASADGDFWRWSAVEVAAAIRKREVSAQEVLESTIGRVEQVNPSVNALIETSFDEARDMARASDARIARGEEIGILEGVPTSVKVNTDQAGHATTDGVVALAQNIADEDSPGVALLRRAGATFVGRSNCPAFSFRWFSNNDLHGSTLNPWSAAHTPGGSSGGAASAVASGLVQIALGGDIGGSVRYPAFACGVVGLRPTPGVIPQAVAGAGREGGSGPTVQMMAVQGPLARSVDDVALALDALTGFDPRDPVSLSVRLARPGEVLPRVGIATSGAPGGLSASQAGAIARAARALEEAGYVVEEVDVPQLEEAYRLWYLLVLEDFRVLWPVVQSLGDDGLRAAARHYFEVASEWWGTSPDLPAYIQGWTRRGVLIAELQAFLERYPILLLPSSTEPPFEQDADTHSVDRMRQLVQAQYAQMAVPVLGLPAAAVPTGVVDGLPAGVQLLGGKFQERVLLEAAKAIESAVGRFTPIDPIR
ncbi:amidase [Streptomyces sp. GbtcB6]|uniref:amidase n=1 Tax=Streptomyces sp. GbtcB6 TaxID=2824751 RepID=UPI001C305A46|nr:amidase [Streptomyces sp. GbtcB6]